MPLRSGAEFVPYALKRPFHPQPPPQNPISTTVDVEPLLQGAVALEDLRFEQGEDDSEGLGVTSRAPSPSEEVESENEAAASTSEEVESENEAAAAAQPHPASGLHSAAKKRRKAAAKGRRAKKRMGLASSGHQPHTYAANPSTVTHHAEEQEPIQVSADADNFPASGSGSWVGWRKGGVKKKPWTVADLVKKDFTFIGWDGW
jgi:hypothetical protein